MQFYDVPLEKWLEGISEQGVAFSMLLPLVLFCQVHNDFTFSTILITMIGYRLFIEREICDECDCVAAFFP
jgi:hypothetical protein